MRCNAELPGKRGLQVEEFFGCSRESPREREAVNPARAGLAPRSSRQLPWFPNWMKSSSSHRSQRKRTRRTGGKEERRRNPARSSHQTNVARGGGRRVGEIRESARGGAQQAAEGAQRRAGACEVCGPERHR
ncbi:hypothetical protein P7K49_018388 [Saguinus oedipus]|uniref:Uncharacterized protein n=1 Tax=Saguinus oedipus TaxID=9490 RepID=A0ABQ9V5Q0_SAGOE|nr:hypothetical protein P7K49_018388 [Saguinus oedipus]